MISSLRALANTWIARLFFFALALSFVGWGVADMVNRATGPGGDNVVSIGASKVSIADFQFAYSRALKAAAARLPDPTQIPLALRQQVGQQVLQTLALQRAFGDQAAALGLATPDDALRDIIAKQAGFRGPDGKFSREVMLQALSNNQLTEAHYLDMMREETTRLQLADGIAAGAYAPQTMVDQFFAFLGESRSADMITVPMAKFPLPPVPADTVLRRYWNNNQKRYSAPEYRHVKLVVLSAQTIGRGIDVPKADIDAVYKAARAEFEIPEKRAVDVITANDDSSAQRLLAAWRGGADWQKISALAQKEGASAVQLGDTARVAIPSPELAAAVFSARAGDFVGPLKQPLGVQIARVLSILPAKSTPEDQARAQIRERLATERAADMVDTRAQKLEDVFAGGATIDEVPADIGAAAASGTLDARGLTQDGSPAPLPGSDAFKRELLPAIFAAKPNAPVTLSDGADHHYYALLVDKVIPQALRPFETVRDKVAADWQMAERRRAAEEQAAAMLADINAGKNILDVAGAHGLSVSRSAPAQRGHTAPDLPRGMLEPLFSLTQGQATMIETPGAFVVAGIGAITKADRSRQGADYDTAKTALTRLLGNDLTNAYLNALVADSPPKINQPLFQKLIEQGS